MKLNRALIGKVLELKWVDPISSRRREHLREIVKGRAGLPFWREFGVAYDITDGVIVLCHSLGFSPGDTTPDEGEYTKVIDDLVTEVTILEPKVESHEDLVRENARLAVEVEKWRSLAEAAGAVNITPTGETSDGRRRVDGGTVEGSY